MSTVERQELIIEHRQMRDRRVADRIKAILLRDEGWSYAKIAKALLLTPETLCRHVHEYQKKKKLKPENGGSTSKLDEEQTTKLIAHLETKTYTKVQEICGYVKETYTITYTRQGMTNWLHAHGFSYKQPKKVPAKADLQKQNAFIKTYENLLNTTDEDEPILFMDSVHPTMATKVSCGWIRTGKDKLIAAGASRTRMNVTGALNLESMTVVNGSYEKINSQSTIEFLKTVEASYKEALVIHVIMDQAGYHRSQDVRDYVDKSRIKIHFLPTYSPNLNPIERLWKVMNEEVRNNRHFKTAKEFREAIEYFFNRRWPEISKSMTSRINDSFQIINPAPSF